MACVINQSGAQYAESIEGCERINKHKDKHYYFLLDNILVMPSFVIANLGVWLAVQ
uniref:Uncharacterized protein n=1 Tax=Anguilla anguilla TaxID=7936 RepID=A0A0E9TC35_ANGAN